MDLENVPDALSGSASDLIAMLANCSPDIDKMLMKKPPAPGKGDNTDRIKRRVRRQSSREGTVANGGGCTVSHMLAHHHRHPSMSSTSSSAAAAAGSAAIHNTYFAPQRRWKNSRRTSRNVNHIGGIGNGGDQRGLPKKGGAGGKGVWGLLGSELLVEEDVCDVNDPNYDSEANDANTELLEVIAVPTADELYKLMVPTLLEYYENGDTHEALQSLREVMLANGAAKVPHLMISGAIELSMNHKDSHREMTSLLISEAYGELVKSEDIVAGFNVLLANLDDLVLDTPEAPTWLGNFIARAVADDCVPPIYVSANQEKEDAEVEANGSKNGDANGVDVAAAAAAGKGRRSSLQKGQLARAAFKRADSLLSLKATMVHLDNIWGSAGPLRPVKSITMSMALLLNEFKDSRDLAEAQRCLHALEVPHYHHELVYEAIVMALEAAGAQQVEEAMCTLLRSMDESCLVSPAMMEQGFQRVYDDMTDIVLDVPLAYILLDRFVERCNAAGFLTEKILANMPSRGRKRFVSEGDGGLFKTNTGKLLY